MTPEEERASIEAGISDAAAGRTYTLRCQHAPPNTRLVCHECLVKDCERWYQLGKDAVSAIPTANPDLMERAARTLKGMNDAFQALYLEIPHSIVDDLRQRFTDYLSVQLELQHKIDTAR